MGTDAKAIKKAIDAIQKIYPNLSFAGIAADSDKLAVVAIVSDMGIKSGFDARAWVQAVVSPYGGRGGETQHGPGSIADFSKMEEAVARLESICSDVFYHHS